MECGEMMMMMRIDVALEYNGQGSVVIMRDVRVCREKA